ncbi:MAG: recombination protein O N-terminal domain-containing protein [Bacteroidales bacterium]|nr:recombination protein O N-terminal domain-containing protein [Bacteroidales bacterium]
MNHSVELIVLHTIKYTESSLLVYAYTDLFGRQTYLLRGARTTKNHGVAAHFFPLHILEAEVYHKKGASIQYIKEFHSKNSLQSIRTNLYKSTIALFLGEVLYKTIKEEEPNATLHRFLSDAIMELDLLTCGVANFHLYFITHLCAHLGYAPDLNYHPEHSPLFDLPQGFFVPAWAASNLACSPELSILLHRFSTSPCASSAASIPLNATQRNDYVDAIIRYLSFHLNTPLELKSPKVLQQIWRNT